MITRRAALRLAALAALASPLASACGRGADRGRAGGATTEVELVRSSLARSAGDPAEIAGVVTSLHALAGGLYGRVAAEPGNVVLSPFSVGVALAMTLPGAAGRTAEEMRDVLGVSDDASFHGGLNALTAYVEGLAGVQERADGTRAELALRSANQLYGQQGVGWEPGFLDVLAREYDAGLRTVDFEAAPEDARALVNAWVARRTQDRIPELVPAGVLDSLTRLVLVNALYLKAPWEVPFEAPSTATGLFRRADGSPVDAPMMVQPELTTTLTEGAGWRAARLPYAGRALAMTVVLPDPGRLPDVERLLASDGWGRVVAAGRRTQLDVRLPRWSFRSQLPLGEVLQQLGMREAFDPERADLSPMTAEDLDLHVGAVLHEGFVAVDEEGTEAAAATAVVVRLESAVATEPFHVDRPFLFVIHDVQHGTPLFLGRVDDPTA